MNNINNTEEIVSSGSVKVPVSKDEVSFSQNGSVNIGYCHEDSSAEVKDSSSTQASEPKDRKLAKIMGYRQGFALMVGLILGSGIFISPQLVAKSSNSGGVALIIWVVAGCLAMMGALCYCELGCIFKMAGSNYINVLKVYGSIPAFLCAWTTCLVIDPSGIAALGLTIGVYLSKPFYESAETAESTAKIIAFCVILIAFTINSMSVTFSNRVQSVFAVAQISAIAFVICLGIWQFSEKKFDNFQNMFNSTKLDSGDVIQVGIALFGALWSYDGWAYMSNAIEEMQNMEKNLLLIIMTGFPFVIICYTLVNVSLMTLLNHTHMAASNAVGVEFVDIALGKKVSYFMMILVGLSAYGTLNGTLFACPRLTLSAAREGHMPSLFSYIHRKTSSPIPATCLTVLIAILMLIPSMSDLDSLILLFSQAQWILCSASFLGVVILRIKQPDTARPFRVFVGIPILMFLVSITLVIIPFFRYPFRCLVLFGFILAGIPAYFVFVYYYFKLPNVFLSFINGIGDKLQRRCGMVPCETQDTQTTSNEII